MLASLAAAALALLGPPQDQSQNYGAADGWIVQTTDWGCLMFAQYDHEDRYQEFYIRKSYAEGRYSIAYYDRTGSFIEGDRDGYRIVIERPGTTSEWSGYSGEEHRQDDGGNVLIGFDKAGSADFGYLVRGADAVMIYRGDEKIADLGLDGNEAALDLLDKCVAAGKR